MKPGRPVGFYVGSGADDSHPLMEDDLCLPEQFLSMRSIADGRPAVAFWIGIVEQALRDARAPKYVKQHERARVKREARAWFVSPSEAVGSFRWIIASLGFDPDAWQDRMRRGIPKRGTRRIRSSAC